MSAGLAGVGVGDADGDGTGDAEGSTAAAPGDEPPIAATVVRVRTERVRTIAAMMRT